MVLITEFLRYFVKADSLTELSVAFLAILAPITAKYSLKLRYFHRVFYSVVINL